MRIKKIILLSVCVVACFLAVGLARLVTSRHQENGTEAQALDLAASAYDRDKLLTKDEYVRLDALGKQIDKAGKISDTDFAWLMQIAEPTFHSDDYRMPIVRAKITARLLGAKSLTSAQKENTFKYATRLLRITNEGRNSLDKIYAVALVKKFPDKQYVPYLLPLTKHPNKTVQRSATAALKRLGVPMAG